MSTGEKMNKKLQPFLVNLGLVFGSLIFGIFVGEIGLRLAGIEAPLPPDPESETLAYRVDDPHRGWAPRANAVTVWAGEGERTGVQMNSSGMRDKERSVNKPENTYRIAFLGDSFVEAIHVPLEYTAAAIMEQKLAECSALKGKNVEVLNFGVQGYGTAQELMTLRHHVWQFSPDLVLLGFYPGNDIRNNYKPLEHDHFRPYFTLENGEWVIDDSFKQMTQLERDYYATTRVDYLPRWLLENSRILQLVRQAEATAKRRQFEQDYEQTNINFYKEPPDKKWEEAWNITEGLITLIQDEVKAKGVNFMVFTVSDSYQVHPKPKKREEFMEKHNIQDLFYPDKRIQALGEREGFTVFRLAEPLQKVAEETGECLHGFENAYPCEGHWNREGNRVAAELMADQICQGITSPQSLKKQNKKP
ncbi:MAG: SGNH/GDSL hydrolase family protein [Limnoraphis sp. WC205]|nr:SGNH/GDSL hydrolase family protein [Limnoraphis sp. WC205]